MYPSKGLMRETLMSTPALWPDACPAERRQITLRTESGAFYEFGSSSGDLGIGVAVGASGVYVAGTTTGTLPGQASAGGIDAFVRGYDVAGNVLWTRQLGTAVKTQHMFPAVPIANEILRAAQPGDFCSVMGHGVVSMLDGLI